MYRLLEMTIITGVGCRGCRLLAPRSRRAAYAAILPCDKIPVVVLKAPPEVEKSLYDRVGGLEMELSKLLVCTQIAIWLFRICCLPSPTRCARDGISGPGADVFPSVVSRRRGNRPGEIPLKSRKARKLLHCPDGAAPPSCPSWFHRPQCLVPLPPAMLGANGGCTATGGGGMKVEGDHRKVNRAAAKQVLLSAQACAQRISAGR